MYHFVIPVLNERDNMEPLFSDLAPRARALGAHVILVDDGSTDGTVEIARDYADGLDLTVVTHPENRGLGSAIDSGIRKALEVAGDDDGIITIEGDNTADLDDLPAMIASFEAEHDLVMGSFFMPGGQMLGVKRWRVVTSKVVSGLFRVLGGLREFHQVTPLYRIYRASILRKAAVAYGNDLICETGFAVNVELLVKLREVDARIDELPTTIDWNRRQGESKLPLKATVVAYLRLLGSLSAGRMHAPKLHQGPVPGPVPATGTAADLPVAAPTHFE